MLPAIKASFISGRLDNSNDRDCLGYRENHERSFPLDSNGDHIFTIDGKQYYSDFYLELIQVEE